MINNKVLAAPFLIICNKFNFLVFNPKKSAPPHFIFFWGGGELKFNSIVDSMPNFNFLEGVILTILGGVGGVGGWVEWSKN